MSFQSRLSTDTRVSPQFMAHGTPAKQEQLKNLAWQRVGSASDLSTDTLDTHNDASVASGRSFCSDQELSQLLCAQIDLDRFVCNSPLSSDINPCAAFEGQLLCNLQEDGLRLH